MKLIKKTLMVATSIILSVSALAMPINAETLIEPSEVFCGWKILEDKTSPADADVSQLGDKDYLIVINNPGGLSNGGTDRWDLQFSYRGFSLRQNCQYRLTFDLTSSANGKFYTKIGDISGQVEAWRNGNTTPDNFNAYWDCIKVGAGQTYSMDCTFTPTTDVDIADWSFHIGGDGVNTPNGCFPAGTSIRISNVEITNLTPYDFESCPLIYNHIIVGNTPGDCTDNGKIDSIDTLMLKKYLLNTISSDEIDMINADYNKDDKVNILDLIQIMNYMDNIPAYY